MQRLLVGLGGVLGAGAVGLSAVAAHALLSLDPHALAVVESAIQTQAWHALAVLAAGLWAQHTAGRARALANAAGLGFALGTLLFSGAIYAHHLAGIAMGPLAPIGGTILIGAWLALAVSALWRPPPANAKPPAIGA